MVCPRFLATAGPRALGSALALAAVLLACPVQAQNEWSAIEPSSSNWSGPPPSAPRPGNLPSSNLQPNARRSAVVGLKTEGQALTGVLPQLLKVQPWQFAYESGEGSTHYGLKPGSLGRAFPNLVKTDLRTGVQTVTTAELLPLLLAAIQEQQQQLSVLQQQHQALAQAYGRLLGQTPGGLATGAEGGPLSFDPDPADTPRRSRRRAKATQAPPLAELAPIHPQQVN